MVPVVFLALFIKIKYLKISYLNKIIDFIKRVDALPFKIWRLASQPYESAHAFGWGAALVLILIILILSASIRIIARGKGIRVRTGTI